jgi:ketosteroid isomerase-like protein
MLDASGLDSPVTGDATVAAHTAVRANGDVMPLSKTPQRPTPPEAESDSARTELASFQNFQQGDVMQATTLDANRQSVRQFFDRFSAGDVAGAVALFHDDATFWYPTTRETLKMPAFAAGLEWIKTRLDGAIRFEIGEMVAENNKIAVQLESFAKTVEGKTFNNLYHIYFEFEGAKIRRGREYNDTANVFSTLRAGESGGA